MSNCEPLQKLSAYGLRASLVDGKVRLKPADKVTDPIGLFVIDHRAAIVEALRRKEPDSFLVGHYVLVRLEPVGDVWLASDEQATEALQAEDLPMLLESAIRWIMQVRGHEARLERLRAIFGKRHPLASTVMEVFQGSKVAGIKNKILGACR